MTPRSFVVRAANVVLDQVVSSTDTGAPVSCFLSQGSVPWVLRSGSAPLFLSPGTQFLCVLGLVVWSETDKGRVTGTAKTSRSSRFEMASFQSGGKSHEPCAPPPPPRARRRRQHSGSSFTCGKTQGKDEMDKCVCCKQTHDGSNLSLFRPSDSDRSTSHWSRTARDLSVSEANPLVCGH